MLRRLPATDTPKDPWVELSIEAPHSRRTPGGWPADPQIVLQSDPGIDLSPANQTGQGSPGSVVSYSVTVTNLDTQPTDYALMAEDYASPSAPPPWPASLIPGRTPVLNTNESASVIVHVQLPDTPRPEERILISALSDRDGGTRQFATVTTGAGAKDR